MQPGVHWHPPGAKHWGCASKRHRLWVMSSERGMQKVLTEQAFPDRRGLKNYTPVCPSFKQIIWRHCSYRRIIPKLTLELEVMVELVIIPYSHWMNTNSWIMKPRLKFCPTFLSCCSSEFSCLRKWKSTWTGIQFLSHLGSMLMLLSSGIIADIRGQPNFCPLVGCIFLLGCFCLFIPVTFVSVTFVWNKIESNYLLTQVFNLRKYINFFLKNTFVLIFFCHLFLSCEENFSSLIFT